MTTTKTFQGFGPAARPVGAPCATTYAVTGLPMVAAGARAAAAHIGAARTASASTNDDDSTALGGPAV